MTGKLLFSIDAAEFVKGASTSDVLADGGFSDAVGSFNLTYEPGVLNGVPSTVAATGTTPTGNPIGWSSNGFVTGGAYKNGFIIHDDGKVGGVSTTQALTLSTALAGTYSIGITDIVQFLTKVFISSSDNLAIMDTDLTGGNATWGTGTASLSYTSGVPHPLLNHIGYLYSANAQYIHKIVDTSTATNNFFALNQQNMITALGVEPSSGHILIATVQTSVNDGSIAADARIFVWDGESPSPEREIRIEGMVTSFRTVGGVTYMWMKDKFGYWNGSGFSFLRKLKNVTIGTSSTLPWKHKTAVIDNTLFMADGTRVLAFGDVIPGKKVPYYCVENDVNSNAFTMICPIGGQKLGLGFSSNKLYTFDTVGTGVGTFNSLRTLKVSFQKPAHVRHLYIEYSGAGVANGDANRTLYYRSGDAPTTAVIMSSLDNNSGGTIFENKDIIGIASNPVRSIQFNYIATTSPGIKRISGYGDYVE